MIIDAINHYHDLLGTMAEATQEVLDAELRKRKLYFGDVPVCRVLRPHFYEKDQWEYLARRTKLILSAFAKAHAATMVDAERRALLDLEPYEEQLFSLDRDNNIKVPWSSSRLDAFYRPETGYLRFVEYNAETPAGIGYGDELTEMFLSLPVMKKFEERYNVLRTFGLPQLLGVVLRGYRDWGGVENNPQICIADWQDVPTLNEHSITADFFEARGYKTCLTDPRDMEYRNGHLYVKDFRVDIIYKRVLVSELVQRMGTDNPIVQAIRDRAVFMTNSFSAKLLAKKASLAFLSDESNADLFNVDERAAIEQHIPWTRRVSDRKTIYEGQEIDLLEFTSQNKEKLVIKPNDDYGGHGVVIGWTTSQEDWEAALKNALNTPYVVQERVTIVEREYPMMLEGKLDISPRFVDANPYVFYGTEVGGCLTRLSSAALLNVTAGTGSVVPMFVVENR